VSKPRRPGIEQSILGGAAPDDRGTTQTKYGSGSAADFWRSDMASITFNDLALSEALDRKAMRSIYGADWGAGVIGAFPIYVSPVAVPRAVDVFNYYQQINNSYTYIGQMVNQTTTVDITNSGANSTNNAVLLTSLGNQLSKA
jgi:hypothetical protein